MDRMLIYPNHPYILFFLNILHFTLTTMSPLPPSALSAFGQAKYKSIYHLPIRLIPAFWSRGGSGSIKGHNCRL